MGPQQCSALFSLVVIAGLTCSCASANAARSPLNTGPVITEATSKPPETRTQVVIAPDIVHACELPTADAYFSFDSSHLTSDDRSPLDGVATCFTQGPLSGRGIKLVGRADPRGASEYNLTLGQARADAVAGYLEARGVSPAKAATTSRGALDAVGTDEETWARDRRVDVLLTN
jgi:peptidoglycan-associated lipoprotein